MSCNSAKTASEKSPPRKGGGHSDEGEEDEEVGQNEESEEDEEAKAVRPGRAKAGAIAHPEDSDVLLGRGKFVNYHPGNIQFRELVLKHKVSYVTCPKSQKPEFAKEIVVDLQSRGARFLKQDGIYWYEIDFKQALLKTRQALREGAPEISEQFVHGRKHIKKPERVIKELLKRRSKDAYDQKHRTHSPREEHGISPCPTAQPPLDYPPGNVTQREAAIAVARQELLQQQEQSVAAATASHHVSFLALQQHQQLQPPLSTSALWPTYPGLLMPSRHTFPFLPPDVAAMQMMAFSRRTLPLQGPTIVHPFAGLAYQPVSNFSMDASMNNPGSPSSSSRGG